MINIKSKLLFSLLLVLIVNPLSADIRTVPISELVPAEKHIRASELITHILTTYHYKKTDLDDTLSNAIYEHYLENLDQNKSYFLNSDIKEFEKYRYQIDDAIRNNNLVYLISIFFKLMTVGSKWQITVPSDLAYGKRGAGGAIGPNATLNFDIELIAIK